MLIAKICIVVLLFAGSTYAHAKSILTDAQLVSLKSNKIVTERDVPGKVLVMDFWATWCESCRKNLAVIDSVLRNRNSETKFMFVSMDEEGPDVARSFFELPEIKQKMTWIKPRAYWDKNQILGKKLAKNGIPYLAAFNSKGQMLFEHDGVLKESDLRKLNLLIAGNEAK